MKHHRLDGAPFCSAPAGPLRRGQPQTKKQRWATAPLRPQSLLEIFNSLAFFFSPTGKNLKRSWLGSLKLYFLSPAWKGRGRWPPCWGPATCQVPGCSSLSVPSAMCLSQSQRAFVGSPVGSLFRAKWLIPPEDQKVRSQGVQLQPSLLPAQRPPTGFIPELLCIRGLSNSPWLPLAVHVTDWGEGLRLPWLPGK